MKVYLKIVAMVIAIVAVVITIVCVLKNQYKKNSLENISTNILQVQAKVKGMKEKSIVENNPNVLVGQQVPEQLLQEFNLKDDENIRILTLEDLNMLGLSNINEDKKYIVDYNSGEVYYIDGFKDEQGEIYYKSSDVNNISVEDE